MNKLDNEANAIAVDSLLNFETVSAACLCFVREDLEQNGSRSNSEIDHDEDDAINALI